MYLSLGWKDYELIDCGGGERLERFGDYFLVRPDPQAIWQTDKKRPEWHSPAARYLRSSNGGGEWENLSLPGSWQIGYKNLRFGLKAMNFKHTGIFPEQAANWDFCAAQIKKAGRPVKVLNLFGYTGCATVACAAAGAQVCHVDAAKGMVAMAKQNTALSGLSHDGIRYIVEDCVKFIKRELRRGSRYDAVIMDPPSYGRGPGGEIWKIEDSLFSLISDCADLLSDNPLFFLISSYTPGLAPSSIAYILGLTVKKRFGGGLEFGELGLPVKESGLALPCGAVARWTMDR